MTTGNPTAPKDYKPYIDGLRAIAVMGVLLYHVAPKALPGGYVGVDVFFVISGYLISQIILNDLSAGTFSLAGFYSRRIRRIWPALFVVIAVTLAFGAIFMTPVDYKYLGESAGAAALFASNFFFWYKTNYFAAGAEAQPLLHTWSLAVEEQFYFIQPLLLWFFRKQSRRTQLVAFIGLIIGSLALAEFIRAGDPNTAFYFPVSRAWELWLGTVIGLMPGSVLSRMARDTLSVFGLALIAVPMLIYNANTPFPGVGAIAPCLGTAFVLAANRTGAARVGDLLGTAPMRFTGRISYSLYLWHWPVIFAFEYFGIHTDDIFIAIAVVCISFILAELSYQYVETPFRHAKAANGEPAPSVLAPAALSALAILAIGGGIYLAQGFPKRLNPEAQSFAVFEVDTNPERKRCDSLSLEAVLADKLCRIGAPTSKAPTFILWGDSYADALVPGLTAEATRLGRRGVISTRGGCYPLLATIQPDKECSATNYATVDWINTQTQIDTVIIAARWTTATTGSRVGAFQQDGLFISDSRTQRMSAKENAAVVERSLAQTLKALKGKRIYLIANIPEQEVVAPRAAALASQFNMEPPRGVPYAIFEERQRTARKAIANAIAASGANVVVIDASKELCNPVVCPLRQNTTILYSDDNHLTASGSRLFAHLFTDALGGEIQAEADLAE